MSEFSDRPLIAGSITGLRSFKVDAFGRLTGVSQTDVWRPGVNEARCYRPHSGCGCMACTLSMIRRISLPPAVKDPSPEEMHRIGELSCSCGFYAYFDEGANPYYGTGKHVDNVRGIVHGHGTVTVGTRGFRASKAELVALIDEPQRSYVRRLTALGRIYLAIVTIALASDVWTVLSDSRPWMRGAVGFVVGAMLSCAWLIRRSPRYVRAQGRRLPEIVRANYPMVPVYPSLKAALAEHPLTPPAIPAPETDADFWTRAS